MRLLLVALLLSSCTGDCSGVGAVGSMRAGDMQHGAARGGMTPPVDGDDAPVEYHSRIAAREPGSTNLPDAITINSVDVTPDFSYRAASAGVSTWAGSYGDTLAINGTGTAPTTGVRGPFGDGSKLLQSATASGSAQQEYISTTTYGTASKDFIWEIALRRCAGGATIGTYATTSDSGNAASGMTVFSNGASTTSFRLYDDTPTLRINVGDADAIPAHGEFAIYHIFVDHGDATGYNVYKDGTTLGSGSAALFGAITGDPLTIGGRASDNTQGMDVGCGIEKITQWSGTGWFAGGATNTTQWNAFALERTYRWAGLNAVDAAGANYWPITSAFAGTKECPRYDATDATVEVYNLGEHLPCISNIATTTGYGASSGTRYEGFAYDYFMTNLVADIHSSAGSWTAINATITDDQSVGPFGDSTADGIVGDGTSNEHGISTTETLTAARWSFSVFFEAGAQGFGYLDDSTIANASAYVDLSDCSLGTVGSATVATVENYGGGLCRLGIAFTGTAAIHTLRALCAASDGGKIYSSSSTDCYVSGAQVELSQSPSTLRELTSARTYGGWGITDEGVYPGNVGTMRVEYVVRDRGAASVGSAASYLATVNNGANTNQAYALEAVTAVQSIQHIRASVDQGSASTTLPQYSLYRSGTPVKFSFAWGATAVSAWAGRATAIDTTVGTMLTNADVTTVQVGSAFNYTGAAQGMIRYVEFYDTQKAGILSAWGDSITRGTPYVTEGEQFTSVIGGAQAANWRGTENQGVGGDDCDQVAARFVCTAKNYAAVFLMCGVNDLAGGSDAATTQTEIEGILSAAATCGVDVVLGTVMPWKDSAGWTAGQQTETETLNTWIRTQSGVGPVVNVVDGYTYCDDGADPGALGPICDSGDAIHPNAAGHTWLASAITSAVGW